MTRLSKTAVSGIGIAMLVVAGLALVGVPVMAIRAAVLVGRATRHADNGDRARERWQAMAGRGRDSTASDATNAKEVLLAPGKAKAKAPELRGIWAEFALFADAKGDVQAYELGDQVGPYRVKAIEGFSVVLEGADGPVTVNIAPYKPPQGWKPKTAPSGKGAAETRSPRPQAAARPRSPVSRNQRLQMLMSNPAFRQRYLDNLRRRQQGRRSQRQRRSTRPQQNRTRRN